MLEPRHKKQLLIPRTSSSQWTDGSNKPNLAEDYQGLVLGAKGAWPEELPSVLWAYKTTTRTLTGETPFNLTYSTEVVIPVEVGITSLRRKFFDEQSNDDQLKLNLDCLDEVRDQAS